MGGAHMHPHRRRRPSLNRPPRAGGVDHLFETKGQQESLTFSFCRTSGVKSNQRRSSLDWQYFIELYDTSFKDEHNFYVIVRL